MTTLAVPQRQQMTNGLVDAMRRPYVDHGLGMLIGDNEAPLFPGGAVRFPYGILWSVEGGSYERRDYSGRITEASYAYQSSFVGRRRDQAEAAADRMVDFLEARDDESGLWVASVAAPDSCSVVSRISDSPAGVVSEGSGKNAVWTAALRFHIEVIPA